MRYNNEIMMPLGVPPPLLNLRSPYRKNVFKSPHKGYLCYKTILCHKVALDVYLMNFFI